MTIQMKYLLQRLGSMMNRNWLFASVLVGVFAFWAYDFPAEISGQLASNSAVAARPTSPVQWEYKVGWVTVTVEDDPAIQAKQIEDMMNSKYGPNGWEMVGVLSIATNHYYGGAQGIALVAYKRQM